MGDLHSTTEELPFSSVVPIQKMPFQAVVLDMRNGGISI